MWKTYQPCVKCREADPDPYYFWKLDTDPDKSEKLDPDPDPHWSRRELWTLTMEVWTGSQLSPGRAFLPMVADLHHFDEGQDPDPDPRLSEKLDPDPH
jgi:hypothetical protein